jgi:formate hydrogenlyase transcriptional activator
MNTPMKKACCTERVRPLKWNTFARMRRGCAFWSRMPSCPISLSMDYFVQDITERERAEKIADEPGASHEFEEIVGASAALKRVMGQVEIVSPTDATVLVLGETGTGKELVARAIHKLSGRRNRPFITLNCAAIPTGLLESELFGYERGAFTGALSQKIGRFERPTRELCSWMKWETFRLELQPKLLRALQEKEFERLGGTRTIPIDVRLLAATNRNLTQMMGDKLFRSDLYYRLKVFPITIPPLREHREDIPVLVRHFTQTYAALMNKQIDKIPSETMQALVNWPWPGNVRELENFIERSVILSPGSTFERLWLRYAPMPLKRPRRIARRSGAGTHHSCSAGNQWVWSAPRPRVWDCRGPP